MKKIGIYYRVSTDKQDLESQKVEVEKWLDKLEEEEKPKKIKIYKDEGISGATVCRPGYQQMLEDSFKGQLDTIVVYRLDRISRSATEALKTILSLDEAGVGFISVTQPVLNLGHKNPFRRTMLAAFSEIAEIERETIIARVKSGLEAARKRGVKLGAPTKVNPEIKDRIIELRSQGLSYRKIMKETGLGYGTVYNVITEDNSKPGIGPESTP